MAFQIRERLSQFRGQLRDIVRSLVAQTYCFKNPSSLKKLTPELYTATIAANREIVEGIKKTFYYLVSPSISVIITFSSVLIRIRSTQH